MRIHRSRRECGRLGIWLCVLLFVGGIQVNGSRIGRRGMDLTWNDGPYQMWGIDISAAVGSNASMKQAVGALNTYAKYGVSTVAISFQPTGFGSGVFNKDGSIGDPALRERVLRLAGAAQERWMIAVLKIFSFEPNARLESDAAREQALARVGRMFKGNRDVILNMGFVPGGKNLSQYVRILRNQGFPGLIGVDLDSIGIDCRAGGSAKLNALAKPVDVLFCEGQPGAPLAELGVDRPVVITAGVEDPKKPGKPHPKIDPFIHAIAQKKGAFLIARLPTFCEGNSTRFDIGGQDVRSGIGVAWYLRKVCDVQLALHGPIQEPGSPPKFPLLDPGEKEEGFVPLFDGRTLRGWTMLSDSWHSFSVKDGVICCNGTSPNGYLRTARQYSDFILRLEVKISPGGNSGVFIHAPLWGRSSRIGFETQVLDGTEADPRGNAGAVYGVLAPKVDAMKPAGEWNTFEITCRGPHVRIKINDKLIHDFSMDNIPAMKDRLREGLIGLQDHKAKVWFRRIRLKEL